MDGIFSKFGIYDFMGIWGPGAIMVTYFTFTLHQPILDFFGHCGITNPGISSTNLLILMYTAVAYTIGVTLHELGRRMANLFNLFHANDVHNRGKISKRPNKLHMLKRIQWDYQEKIKVVIPTVEYESMSFDKAISYLKYNNINTSRIDTYHSIYALSRSLTLTFFVHLLFSFVAFLRNYPISLWYYLFDSLLIFLFFVRTYRYHYFWVESIYIQYFLHTRKEKELLVK